MQVTNGKVTFSRTVKPADYEGATCAVELSFLIEAGDDPTTVTNTVAKLAQEQALERLGRKVQAQPDTKTVTGGNKETAAANLNAADKKPPGRPPKVVKPAEPEPTKPTADPAAVTGDESTKASTNDAASVVEEGDDAILGAESVPEITDKTLTDAITRKNASLQKTIGAESPKKIRTLIAKYAGPVPKQSRDIPMSQRQNFLKELEALA